MIRFYLWYFYRRLALNPQGLSHSFEEITNYYFRSNLKDFTFFFEIFQNLKFFSFE